MTPDASQDALAGQASPPAALPAGRPAGQRFTPTDRVRRRQDYEAVYEFGARLSGSLMTVFFHRNALGRPRLGIAATRKIGRAVGRNRAKRRVREVFRRSRIAEAVDIVVIPRRELIAAPFERVEAEFLGIVNRHRRRGAARA